MWLARCLLDLGLSRRPILEPNLNASGLACLAVGVLGLLVTETISLPIDPANRNPADSKSGQSAKVEPELQSEVTATVSELIKNSPLPETLRKTSSQVVLRRIISSISHLALTIALIAVGWRHFERPISGLAAATGYLLLPYTRFRLDDAGQVLPAALITLALLAHRRPMLSGLLIGFAAGWMPACVGLIPLWCSFYRGKGVWRFAVGGFGILAICALVGVGFPNLAVWGRGLGTRSLLDAGLMPQAEAPAWSFWSGIDSSYRLPVLVAYLLLVGFVTIWPLQKNLGELIALSAALLIASQFWYLEGGGTMVLLYSPMLLLMMFRPNLITRRAFPRSRRPRSAQRTVASTL